MQRRQLIKAPPPPPALLPCCPAALLPSSPSPLPLSAAAGQCPESSAFDCKGEERLMYYKVEVERKKIQFLKEQ